jgi:antitoxin ParD1/3/4
MQILLKPELEKFVVEKVKAGQYADASDIVNEALEILREQEEITPEHEACLKREVQHGLEQLDRGEFSEFGAEQIIAEERHRLAKGQGPG